MWIKERGGGDTGDSLPLCGENVHLFVEWRVARAHIKLNFVHGMHKINEIRLERPAIITTTRMIHTYHGLDFTQPVRER